MSRELKNQLLKHITEREDKLVSYVVRFILSSLTSMYLIGYLVGK